MIVFICQSTKGKPIGIETMSIVARQCKLEEDIIIEEECKGTWGAIEHFCMALEWWRDDSMHSA